MGQFDPSCHSNQTPIIPLPSIFSNRPRLRSSPGLDESEALSVAQFLEAYNHNPAQYGNKKLIDLIHPGWVQNSQIALILAAKMKSAQFYQFLLDSGANGEISNRQFLENCFYHKELSYTFTQYLFDLYPNRITLIPPNILLSLLSRRKDLTLDVQHLFWQYCPQLRDHNFLNSEIRMPCSFVSLIGPISECIADGGYNGDLSSRELEERYQIAFNDQNLYLINFLTSKLGGSLRVLRFLTENSDISLVPLYRSINPVLDSRDDLVLLGDNINDFIENIFCGPHLETEPIEDIIWYLNWWKNDVLGDIMSLSEFKTFIFNLFSKSDFIYWNVSSPLVEYLGDDFFATLSSNQILTFFETLLKNLDSSGNTVYLTSPDNTPSRINTLLSLPSVVNIIRGNYCVHFTRSFLFWRCRWDCAELFLRLGELTMEQIWTEHNGGDDNNDRCAINNRDNNANNVFDTDGAFTLKTLISSPCAKDGVLPADIIDWLSYQPGTQDQLIKMVKFDLPRTEPLLQIFLFMKWSYYQQNRRHHLHQLQPELYQEQQRRLNPFSLTPKSMSWLQTLIAYAPIDYMNVPFSPKLWNNYVTSFHRFIYPVCSPQRIEDEVLIGLCHLPVIMNEGYLYDTTVFLLDDIIQGVIAALLINHQHASENDENP